MDNNIIAAIDIGTSKIAVAIAEILEKGYQILEFSSKESQILKRGNIVDIEEASELIKLIVKEASQKVNKTIKDVILGISGEIFIEEGEKPYVISQTPTTVIEEHITAFKQDILNSYSNPNNVAIDVIFRSFKAGNDIIENPIGLQTNLLHANFYIICIDRDLFETSKNCIEKAGFTIKKTILNSVASATAVLNQDEKNSEVITIDIGDSTTDIAVFKNNRNIFVSTLQIGSNLINNDLKIKFNINNKQAEYIKTKCGSAVPSENQKNIFLEIQSTPTKKYCLYDISEVIYYRMSEILRVIEKQLNEYNLYFQSFVFTGGGSLLCNFEKLASHIFNSNVRIASPQKLLQPQYSTLSGLVLCTDFVKKELTKDDLNKILEQAIYDLKIEYAENDNKDRVTQDIKLPTKMEIPYNGKDEKIDIIWVSKNDKILTNTGKIIKLKNKLKVALISEFYYNSKLIGSNPYEITIKNKEVGSIFGLGKKIEKVGKKVGETVGEVIKEMEQLAFEKKE